MSKTYEALKRAEALRAKQRDEAEPFSAPGSDVPIGGSDDYYELRRRLADAEVGTSLKTIVLASALHGEGTSSMACLLARALAERGRSKVLLVDMNLRAPSLWRLMDAKGQEGMTSVLCGDRKLEEVVQETDTEGLSVITAGNGQVDAIDMIDNERAAEVVRSLGSHADIVLIDAAPVTLYPDSRALAPLVDGVILVVEADVTPVSVVTRAVDLLRETEANVIGVVLNKQRDHVPEQLLQLIS